LSDRDYLFLAGVVLQDAEEDFMGNLVVYPGSHFELQNYFQVIVMRVLHMIISVVSVLSVGVSVQVAGFEEVYREGTRGLPRIPLARGHHQIHAKYMIAHMLNT
jgi:hypothetical protein